MLNRMWTAQEMVWEQGMHILEGHKKWKRSSPGQVPVIQKQRQGQMMASGSIPNEKDQGTLGKAEDVE